MKDPIDWDDERVMTTWVKLRNTRYLDELYKRHAERTFALCLGILHRRFMADDANQETWLQVATIESWIANSFRRWVSVVAYSKSIDALRGRRNEANDPEDELERMSGEQPIGCSAEELIDIRRELAELVAPFVARMPEDERTIWLLHHRDGLTFPAIAEKTNQPVNSIKGRVGRATRSLRKFMIEGGEQPTRGLEGA